MSLDLSPKAFRSQKMCCARLPSSTKESGQTALSNSSLVTNRPGLATRYVRTSNAFGEMGTSSPLRANVRLPGSSTNSSKRYNLLTDKGMPGLDNS